MGPTFPIDAEAVWPLWFGPTSTSVLDPVESRLLSEPTSSPAWKLEFHFGLVVQGRVRYVIDKVDQVQANSIKMVGTGEELPADILIVACEPHLCYV